MPLDLSVVCRITDPVELAGAPLASLAARVAECWLLDPGGISAGVELGAVRRVPLENGAASVTPEEAALRVCTSHWVLWLEPGELAHPALFDRIERLQAEGTLTRMGAYRVTVRTVVLGRVLRGGGSAPRSSLRLFRRVGGRFAPRPGAEFIAPPAGLPLGRLREAIEEHPFPGLDAYLRRADRQTAREFAGAWPRPQTFRLLLVWPSTFLRHWIFEGGMRDGRAGAIWAGARASAAFVRAMRIWVHAQTSTNGADPQRDEG